MRICTSITDAEVERARNVLKTNMLFQLDGMFDLFYIICSKLFITHLKLNQIPPLARVAIIFNVIILIHLYLHSKNFLITITFVYLKPELLIAA